MYLPISYQGEFIIPDGINTICPTAFDGCSGLTSINIPDGVTTISDKAFQGCRGLMSVNIPESVTSIGSYAFRLCLGLTSITIPNNVTTLGNYAFDGCSGLTSINISNRITAIGDYVFSDCRGLTSVNIPESVTSIGSSAFYNCRSLTSIIVPENVTLIGNGAFQQCYGLSSIVIPNSVGSIGNYAFYNCQKLTSVYSQITNPFEIDNSVFGSIAPKAKLQVPYGTKEKYQAYSGWSTNFVEIVEDAPATYTLSVTATGNGSATYSETSVREKMSTFTVNEGASATITFAPDNGYRIKSVEVNSTDVTSSVSNNQYTISNIIANTTLEVEFEEENVFFTAKTVEGVDMTFKVISESDKTCQVGKDGLHSIPVDYDGNITIPEDVNGYHVIRIGRSAFDHCNIKSIIMPSDIQSIYGSAFNCCYSLQSVALPRNLEKININAFNVCTALKDITIPSSVDYIGEGAFRACRSLEKITVEEGNTHFDSRNNCNAIIETSLNELRFGCKNTIIPITVTTIGKYAFPSVDESSVFVIPDNIVSIKEYAFEVCNGLSSVVIPNSVKEIGNMAFYGCTSLVKVKSLIETPFTILNGTFNNISPDAILYVPLGTKSLYETVGWNRFFQSIIEDGDKSKFSLSIIVTGNGLVIYDGKTIRDELSTFTVEEGTSATITFTPDNGYRIKSVKVNNVVVTSNVIDNQYTISNISSDTSVEVEFEAIPTYTLKIASTGNGYATYNGTAVRSGSNTFTVLEGTSATISLTADDGYRVKSVKVNNQDATASVANNRYIINNISANTTVEVTFEEIPPTTYTLSITATGNGSVTYGETTLKNQTQQFTVNEGLYATIAISPESGYRIKSVVQNGTDVTASVSNNQYTTSKITDNTSLEVTFELIPIPTYTLTITATGNGTAVYNTATIKNQTQQFTVNEGTSVTVMFNPDNGNSIKSVKVNGTEVTSEVSGNRYVISSMAANTTVEVEFKEDINALTVEGVNFTVTSQSDKSIVVAGGNYGQVLTVPATVTQDGTTWTVKGIDNDALKNNTELAAVIWNAEAGFTATVSNPNLLLYVKAAEFAPSTIKNVIVNGIADNITLMDASSGNGFYCPQAFTAQKITYTHYYSMTTGIGESRGWETIALPFDVQTVTHESKGTIVPFANWKRGDAEKPFWLYELTGSGFVAAGSIKAYTPYIISMPNNPQYDAKWRLNGRVTFTASSVTVGATENVHSATYTDRTFTPCFTDKTANEGLLALNVINDYSQERGGSPEGSRFIMNLRNIHPFEAYMTTTSNARAYIDVFEDMTTDIETIGYEPLEKEGAVYDLKGHKVKTPSRKGVYIINGKKQIIK